MSPPKETMMILKVDLDCPRCYRKVKKLLCSFPQIQDQVYNKKENTVMIKVVGCCPEKIRDKLCCKGGKSIKSIEIVEPKKPAPPPPGKPAEKPPPPPPPAQKPPSPEKPKGPPPTPAPAPAPPPADQKPPEKKKNGNKKPAAPPAKPPGEAPPKPKDPEPAPKPPPPKPAPEPKPAPPPPAPPPPEPIQCYPKYPVNVCCWDCYHGRSSGPCYHGYGVPPPPPPPASWWYYDGCGSGKYGYRYKPGYCVSRCGDYISEDNPTACVIM